MPSEVLYPRDPRMLTTTLYLDDFTARALLPFFFPQGNSLPPRMIRFGPRRCNVCCLSEHSQHRGGQLNGLFGGQDPHDSTPIAAP